MSESRGLPWILGAAGIVVALLAMGVAWALSPADQGQEVVVGGGATGNPNTPPSTEDPGPPDPPDELEALVEELSGFVEQQRGREFEEPVEVEVLDDTEFEDRLLEDFDEDLDEIEESGDELTALGFLEPGTDYAEEQRGLLGAAVVGFYDPETGELVVRGAELSPYVRITIVHELVHALDDQHFELDRPEYDEAESEVGLGFSAVVEGTATVVEEAYRATLTPQEQAEAEAEEQALGLGIDADIPLVLIDLLTAPYVVGEAFVGELLEAGGADELAEAFEDPPSTSEQLLEPERYLAGEEAVEVQAPPADGEVFDEGAFGALLLAVLLGTTASDPAIEGWGGDHYVAWYEGEQTCLRTAFVGDTDQDTAEIADALGDWAADRDFAEVSGEDPVVLTTCA